MKLFPDRIRDDARVKRGEESDFAFIDRSPWSSMGRVRQLLETCFTSYPSQEQAEILARVHSNDARHFRSATTELVIHEFLRRQGFALQPHPELPNGSSKRPDFLVAGSSGATIYLEVVSAAEDDGDDIASEARMVQTLQFLEAQKHTSFLLDMHSSGRPVTQPSGKRLLQDVLRWLGELDPDALLNDGVSSFGRGPELRWQHEDWHLTFRAIPRPMKARAKAGKLIGIRSSEARIIDGWSPIRDAIMNKSRRYGSLDRPLVIAVNVNAFDLDEIDELQALFGEEQFVFRTDSEHMKLERKPNGAWIGPDGPRYTRCSGVWMFGDLSPYSLVRLKHTMYLNPFAKFPVPAEFLTMPHASVVDGSLLRRDGHTFTKVFELQESWPE